MDVFYLNVRQGAATSIFGALGKEIFLGNSNENDNGNGNVEEYDKGGRWCEHPMIPYFIPYRMPIRALGFEISYGLNPTPQSPIGLANYTKEDLSVKLIQ